MIDWPLNLRGSATAIPLHYKYINVLQGRMTCPRHASGIDHEHNYLATGQHGNISSKHLLDATGPKGLTRRSSVLAAT